LIIMKKILNKKMYALCIMSMLVQQAHSIDPVKDHDFEIVNEEHPEIVNEKYPVIERLDGHYLDIDPHYLDRFNGGGMPIVAPIARAENGPEYPVIERFDDHYLDFDPHYFGRDPDRFNGGGIQ